MSKLQEEIEQKSKEIITDNYSMSVGELISMYKEGDLDIHPEFQRTNRSHSVWRTIAATFRLSESRVNLLTLPSMRKVNIVNYQG